MAISLELTDLNLLLTWFGIFILGFGCFSYHLKEHISLSEAPLAVAVGILLGPFGLNNIFHWTRKDEFERLDEITLGLSRVIIGIQLVLVGVQLPLKYLKNELYSLLILLIPVMTVMWLLTTACITVVFPNLPILVTLVIASCATATDPVLSNSIVKGSFADSYVPPRLRNLISGESGANDGFGYPFLFIAVQLIKQPTTSKALRVWFLENVLYQVGGSVLYGALVGWLALQMLRWSVKRGSIDRESYLIMFAAIGAFTVGSAGIFGMDDLLACFVAGNTFSWDDAYRLETTDDQLQPTMDLLLNITFFLFAGAAMPFDDFSNPELGITPWKLVLLGVLVLLFRRLPALLAFYRVIPSIEDAAEAAFLGFYGPIGAGAIFYASLVLEEFKADDPSPSAQMIRAYVKPIIYSLVLTSIIGHSLTIPLLKLGFEKSGVGSIKLDDGTVMDIERAELQEEEEREEEERARNRREASRDSSSTEEDQNTLRARPDLLSANSSQSALRRRSSHLQEEQQPPSPSWRLSSGHKLEPHGRVERTADGKEVFHPDPDHPTLRNYHGNRNSSAAARNRSTSRSGFPTVSVYGSSYDPNERETNHRLSSERP